MSRIKSMLLTGVPASGALGGGAAFLPFVDSFDTDGAMAAPWLNTGWAVSGGAAVAAVTLGEELLTNGDFSAWTADNPDAWSVLGEAGVSEISEVGSGESHGGSGTGALNIYRGDSNIPQARQTALTTGQWFNVALTVSAISGTLRAEDSAGNMRGLYTSTGSQLHTGLASATVMRLYSVSATVNITVDNVSSKQIYTSSMLQLVDAARANVTATVKATITANTQAGIALCLDSDTSPANGVIGFYDRTNNHANLFKVVAGTWTSVIDAAAAYSAGSVVKVVQTGNTTFQLWYNGTQVGTDVTISDAGIISNTLHGIFSTYANSFDDFTLEAS